MRACLKKEHNYGINVRMLRFPLAVHHRSLTELHRSEYRDWGLRRCFQKYPKITQFCGRRELLTAVNK